MASIGFDQVGSFNGIAGGNKVIANPTSLQFGPDGRLYVAEQNGSINAFTVTIENDEYIATAHEELFLANGGGVVKSIQNHNDNGSLSGNSNRQVTGLIVAGTAENPVLYISSSDPRISQNGDVNLDTNSGVVTQVTWNGDDWEAVDIVRGLPRSEENHSINGLQLSPDGSKLYLAVGGNTNNGAPSQFFSFTAEYALSGTVLEIDLDDINSRPVLTDIAPGQDGRQYVYDLPTLDDPTVENVTDGVGEDEFGLDEAGPWGGNDGLNQAILPADAPLRIFADGLRNHYDLVLTEAGKLYTVDNGSNVKLGGNPLDADGTPTDQPGAGEPTNTPNASGPGDPEPLFLLEDGGYYGHPNPVRSNQDLEWVVYDDDGNPDTSLTPNSVPNVSALVPDAVDIEEGFIIDPTKFTGNATRLTESGIRIERDSPNSNAITTLGSSSNGLVEYTGDAFDGALKGALIVTQFNGNVTLLNLNDDGTALEPLIAPGDDGLLGTADDEVIDEDGIFPLVSGQSQPLDVTVAPDGAIWVAEFGSDNIKVFAPSDLVTTDNSDFDNDGIINIDDPFIRDAANGGEVLLLPNQTLLWDFDANQDDNRPGENGYGGGLTGVMIDGSTNFEAFFQEPSTLPGQLVNLDNVKFTTAAGGGTTVIEAVSNGDPFQSQNSGEYLFHTGLTIDPTVDNFTIKWGVFNPADEFTGPFQQIGGYIGTGDQSNYLKIVALQSQRGEIQIVLEDDDVVQTTSFLQANDLFEVPPNQKIFFELEIDPTAGTATPTVTYETGGNNTKTVSGTSLDLSGTAVLDAIQGNYTVQGETSGLAVGLLSTNNGQSEANTFQAIFDEIEITANSLPDAPELAITDVSVDEAEGTATFIVNLSEAATSNVTVDYDMASGTAIAGSDYTDVSGTLTFAAGETSQSITVDIIDDSDVEPDETFTVTLANASGAAIADDTGIGTILNDDTEPDPEGFLFTLFENQTLKGLPVSERDIVLFDGTEFSLFFDGSDVGLTSNTIEIDAFDAISENEILLSFDEAVRIPGVGHVDDSDLVLFTATSLGEETAGSFSLYFDGSDVGLTTNAEDIDGLVVLEDGSLLISTVGEMHTSRMWASDEDVSLFTPTSLGQRTRGRFSPFFDGSDVGLGGRGEDIDAFSIDANGDFIFSADSAFTVPGVSGADEDVFVFTPSSTGKRTRGSFASDLLFDWSDFGFSGNDIEGLDLTLYGPSSGLPEETSIRFEVVEADIISKFRPEIIDVASGGQVYSLAGRGRNEVGSATFGFNEAPGTYDIIIGTFDENDGLARFEVELNDFETGTTIEIGSLELDDNRGSHLPDAATIISPTVAFGVALTPGDSITVNGFEDGSEFARLDYIELTPVDV